MKYRKKPIVIDAFQLNDRTYYADIYKFFGVIENEDVKPFEIVPEEKILKIKTLEGTLIARVGDYIIKGINGEFYPCKPDIFEQTYELV